MSCRWTDRPPRGVIRAIAVVAFLGSVLAGCEPAAPAFSPLAAQEALSPGQFAALIERISEEGGYFDTDNLISNESGYLNVIDALARLGVRGGAYIGVGPDQNYSYIAEVRPEIAFITDVRRDNLLHHLLLKALVERAPTPAGFLAGLHGVGSAPPAALEGRDIEIVVAWVDSMSRSPRAPGAGGTSTDVGVADLQRDVRARIDGYGLGLSEDDHATIRRFHDAFIRAGLDLRFTSYGRPPRPYYPTYRQLVLETDEDGDRASWLSSTERYDVVRELHLRNRIVPVVGDLAGGHAMREMGTVLRELATPLSAIYTSNVEYYLWQDRSIDRWMDNLAALPTAEDAVVIRSYFPNAGGQHPSALPGYWATQSLQSVRTLSNGPFRSYWDLVTRDVIPPGGPGR